MSSSASPRRSTRLRGRKASLSSDFDYPDPRQNSVRAGRVRKSARRNRRIQEQVIVTSDDDSQSAVTHSPKNTSSRPTPISRSSSKDPVNAISSPIAVGRVRKPIARRQPLFKKGTSSIAVENDIPTSKAFLLPTSPLSTQDSHDIGSDQFNSVPTHTNLSLGYEAGGPVLGREEESKRLSECLATALQQGQPSTGIYVCGTPGTGKTYTVSKVAKRIRGSVKTEWEKGTDVSSGEERSVLKTDSIHFKEIWVNCANLRQAKDLFSHLVDQLNLCPSQKNPREAIREYASSTGPKTLVVLDEVDFLTSKDQMVLYSAFEWPRISKSRIVVVGIANSIDLPVRLLPWLRQAGCMPEIVSFTPYGARALQEIVEQRIDDIGSSGLTAVAISLAAKKVAAGSGDARLMLDVCHEAQVEMQREGHNKSCISVVSSIISRRGGLSAAVETIRQLPVQQQLALCVAANAVLLASRTVGSGKAHKKATLGGLYDSFVRMCQRAHVSIVSFPEFADMCCNSLTHHGLVDVPSTGRGKSLKTLRGRPIRLRVPVEDVRAGIADKGFLPMLVVK